MPSRDVAETRTARVGDIDIAYESFGDPSDPTVLLVMGLSTQMIAWPDGLCEDLAAAGHHVVRFDNRDIGLSTHVATPPPSLPAMLARRGTPYTISDMAGDAVGLLDDLDVERAHVVGVSMGGFISQTIAVEHPERVATLSLLMTSTGSRRVGRPSPAVMRTFVSRKPITTREEAIEGAVATYRLIGSPDLDEDMVREMAGRSFDRGHDPAGPQRQLAAVLAQPDRTRALRRLDVPAVVLHGLDDPIVHVSGGVALARAIPGARFVGYHATGHDLPRSRTEAVRDEVLASIDRAAAPVGSRDPGPVPELIEVEQYRRAADAVVGRTIADVSAPDPWYCKGVDPATLVGALTGATVEGTRRRGKLLMLDTDGPVLGLRFGMTGRLVVDGAGPIDRLEYASGRDDPGWHRFALGFAGGGALVIVDPRRLGGVELDPDLDRLGPDAASIGPAALRDVLAGSTAPLKGRLMDQSRLAGVGNLICDETLWRAGLDPAREAGSLDAREVRRLHRHLRATIDDLTERGGSHTGDLQAERNRDGRCPRCGTPLDRRTVAGRTTYSCPRHQRR